MKKSELLKLLNSHDGDPDVVVQLRDAPMTLPIHGAATFDNSPTPDTIHLITKAFTVEPGE